MHFTRELYNDVIRLNHDGFGEAGEFHSIAEVWTVSRAQALGETPTSSIGRTRHICSMTYKFSVKLHVLIQDHHLCYSLQLEQALDVLMKVAFQISVPRGPSPLDGSTKIQSSSSNIYQS